MTHRRFGVSRRDDSGAYLVLYALLGVAFATMAAVVLDIAALRQGRRVDRTTADLAASAGVAELHDAIPTAAQGACQTAWGYILANRNGEAGSITPPPCASTFPSGSACTSATAARTATATLGPLTVEITHPVPDDSPLMLAEAQGGDIAQPVDPVADGRPCSRLAIRIVRTRTFLFGQLAGVGGASTDIHSVGRAFSGRSTTEVPSVIALEPTGCNSLITDPGAGALHLGSATQAGVALVDSDGSTCANGQYIISPGGTGDPADRIRAFSATAAPGRIASYALGRAGSARTYDPVAVPGRLNPAPTPAFTRTGRRIIDDRYRCPTCGPAGNPIGELEAARAAGPPAGATTYTGPCSVNGPSVELTGATHLYVDCPDFVVDTNVTFLGESITFNGNVLIGTNSCFAVNSTACGASGIVAGDADLYVRGNVTKATKGQLVLPRTFVYTTGTFQVGVDQDIAVGNSTLDWTAPTSGPFEDLLFWSESSGQMVLGEQRNVAVVGTFFAPNAPVALNPRDGGTGVTAEMQLVARTVRVSGSGTYRLQPTPDRATGGITEQVRLLR